MSKKLIFFFTEYNYSLIYSKKTSLYLIFYHQNHFGKIIKQSYCVVVFDNQTEIISKEPNFFVYNILKM